MWHWAEDLSKIPKGICTVKLQQKFWIDGLTAGQQFNRIAPIYILQVDFDIFFSGRR